VTHTQTVTIDTEGFNDTRDLTEFVEGAVRDSKLSNGIATIFVPGSTAGITTIEFEDGAVSDLSKAIERISPENIPYSHNQRWGDGNGFSHVRAAIIGPSTSVPVCNGRLQLGTWQQIVLVDFDNRPRSRTVIVQLVGE
jgi:secondary thiamine-phosphate synthase enzyme